VLLIFQHIGLYSDITGPGTQHSTWRASAAADMSCLQTDRISSQGSFKYATTASEQQLPTYETGRIRN